MVRLLYLDKESHPPPTQNQALLKYVANGYKYRSPPKQNSICFDCKRISATLRPPHCF